jgi:hypothetical protein
MPTPCYPSVMPYKDKDKLKEYNRQRAETLYESYKARRQKLYELLGGCCYLCGALEGKWGLHLHHMEYHPTESDYPRDSSAMSTRLKRITEAENNLERFRLLCPQCHRSIEMAKVMTTNPNLNSERLFELLEIK